MDKRRFKIELSLVQLGAIALAFLATLIATGIFIGYQLSPENDEQSQQQDSKSAETLPIAKGTQPVTIDSKPDIDLAILADAVNVQRQANGLPGLLRDELLDKSAQDKCNDMVTRDYWSHDAPDGTEPWVFIRKYNVYGVAGENLAYGFRNEQGLVDGWMKSPGHRANIVNVGFTNVGYATCVYGPGQRIGQRLVVQFLTDDPTRGY